MTTRFRLLFLPLLSLFLSPAFSVWAQQQPAAKIDVSKLRYSVSEVVVPVPSEIFNALDHMGGSLNWTAQVAPESKFKPTHPAEIALMLGTVIANGFIAVEAKDANKVQEIGRQVIVLASALGVKEAVLEHCNAIIDASKRDDWLGVRSELDKTQANVRDAMVKLHSKDQSELVSIAGWLRGTQALSSLISLDYKPDRADLLHQPDMLATFESQFKSMEARVQGDKKVVDLREGLQKIKPLIDGEISEKAVQQINQITTALVKSIAP
jgi:hypothetical protein